MKKIILSLAFTLIITVYASAQKIHWVTVEQAVALQQKEPKKIIMDMYTNWCGPCKLLDRNTFNNPDVAAFINAHYYAVKFNAEGNEAVTFKGNSFSNPGYDPAKANGRNTSHQFAQYLQVGAYPTIVFLDEKANLLTPIIGYKTPQQLELFLKLFKDDTYLSVDTKEKYTEYLQRFKPQFSN